MRFILPFFSLLASVSWADVRVVPVAADSELKANLSMAMRRMFDSETARKALCPFTSTDQTFAMYLGEFPELKSSLRELCKTRNLSPVVRGTLQAMASRFIGDPEPMAPIKAFYFLGEQDEFPRIDSFTNKANKTFFLIKREDMKGMLLIRILAHEFAMSYDQLARLGYLNDPTTWEQGLNPAFGRPLYTHDRIFEPLPNAEEVSCALRDPAIRYALATERAFRFEDRVIEELGMGTYAFSARSRDFSAAIARWSGLHLWFSQLIAWERMKYEVACGPLAGSNEARDKQINERADFLSRITLHFTGSNRTIKLIDLLLEPHVGPFHPDIDGGGPRPRIGGWGG